MIYEFFKTTFIFLLVIAFIVACGVTIVRSIDYIEENTYAVKEKIRAIVYVVIACHMYMMYVGMPLWHAIFSLSIQYAFHCFFDIYPLIKPEDPKFIYGVVGSLINHFLLIVMFVKHASSLVSVALCFIIIWTTPFCFFFIMSASEDVLFIKDRRGTTRTYVGMALEWLWNVGRNVPERRD